jgi:hypothetical protein
VKRPYLLFTQFIYDEASAGMRALFKLVHELNLRGYDAYTSQEGNPDWIQKKWFGDHGIIIYPETITGNPLQCDKVVRWILFYPDFFQIPMNPDPDELTFSWDKKFITCEDNRILKIDVVEKELFNSIDLPDKPLYCSYFGKGRFNGLSRLPLTKGLIEIDYMSPNNRADLAALLRSTNILYTYDKDTMLNYEAILCGCKVVYVPDESEITLQDTGMDISPEEYERQLQNFIDVTQNYDWE